MTNVSPSFLALLFRVWDCFRLYFHLLALSNKKSSVSGFEKLKELFSNSCGWVKVHSVIFWYLLPIRMFTTVLDLQPNDCGEYEVASGVSATMFRAILVSSRKLWCNYCHEWCFGTSDLMTYLVVKRQGIHAHVTIHKLLWGNDLVPCMCMLSKTSMN